MALRSDWRKVDADIEISLLWAFPEPVSLEPKEINKIMEKIFTEQKIQEEVEACVKRAC